MQERRNYKRYNLECMEVSGEIPFASDVKILDISLSGVLLETDRRPEMGHSYMLKFESKGEVLTLKGIVIRSTLEKSYKDSKGNVVPAYTVGMHFTDLSTEQILKVASFINKYIMNEDDGSEIYGTGIEFFDMSPQDEEKLKKVILTIKK